MAERPILFSGPMVRAILDGRKTQTRRVMKAHHLSGTGWPMPTLANTTPTVSECYSPHSPYGQPGDRLWVRETWATLKPQWRPWSRSAMPHVNYRATDEIGPYLKWRPSIFMPRWACRITLEVTGVRVERLQDISEEDARAEGVEFEPAPGGLNVSGWRGHRFRFANVWDDINGPHAWVANPWVWVLEFRRIEADRKAVGNG